VPSQAMASQHNCITLTLFLSKSSDCNNDHSHQFSKVILPSPKTKKRKESWIPNNYKQQISSDKSMCMTQIEAMYYSHTQHAHTHTHHFKTYVCQVNY
jgi:hypothetical protein